MRDLCPITDHSDTSFICHGRWERSGFDVQYGKLSDQLRKLTAELDTAVTSLDVARTVERHAVAEMEVLRAQDDTEQACKSAIRLLQSSQQYGVVCCLEHQ